MKKLIIIGICLFLFLLSIGINIFLLAGKGIKVTNSYDQRSFQYQNQSQSQIIVHLMATQGFAHWKFIKFKANSNKLEDDIKKNMENLSAYQALFSKIFMSDDYIWMAHPVINENEDKYNPKKKQEYFKKSERGK